MQALAFWKTIIVDQSNFLDKLVALLNERKIFYCVIGGQAVNAYAEPLVSLDLDLTVGLDQIETVELLMKGVFKLERFPHSLNVSMAGSDLRVQIQTDPRYFDFVERATRREVLGLSLPVAAVEDVLKGKVWAAQDAERRASKRQKDLADIARLLEAHPQLRAQVPEGILKQLVS